MATGLYHQGARYYIPAFGRWLSADPAGFNDGTNLYLYVGANPVSHSDPTGLGKTKQRTLAEAKTELSKAKKNVKNAEQRVATAEARFKNKPTQHNFDRAAKARKERGTAKSAVTRLTREVTNLSAAKAALKSRPAYNNPGGKVVQLLPPNHPGPSQGGTLVASPSPTAYIADLAKKQRDPQTESDVRNFTVMVNAHIQQQPTKSYTCVATNRTTTGSIGYQAGQIADKERTQANNASPGTYGPTQVVGHVPDVAMTGKPYSPEGWFAQTKISNNIVGGGLYAGRVVTEYLVKEQNGNVYRYS